MTDLTPTKSEAVRAPTSSAESPDATPEVCVPTPGQLKEFKQELIAEAHIFRGPIPHPSVLAEYNKIMPDAAERIFAMAEGEQRHRHQVENRLVDSAVSRADSGLKFGYRIALVISIGAIILLAMGRPLEGLTTLLGTVATVAGTFIYTTYTARKERKKKPPSQDNQPNDQLSLPLE